MSIRLRLTLWSTLLLAVALTALALLVYGSVSTQMADRLDTTLAQRADDIRPELGRTRDGGRRDGHRDCVPGQAVTQQVELGGSSLYAQQVDACGNLVLQSTNLPEPLPVPDPLIQAARTGGNTWATLDSDLGELRVLANPDGGGDGDVLLVATPTSQLRRDLGRLRLELAAIVAGTVALSAAIGWFLATQAMRPVDRITRAAGRIAQTADPSGRVPVPPQRKPDEIGRLAGTFNEMLERLHVAFTTQRQFLADASHELRSPLTAVRANVESLRRDRDLPAAERDETLRVVEREVERMGRLVDDLLTLARADAGQEPARAPVALDELLLEVYHQQRPLAGRVAFGLGEFEPVSTLGDRDRLKQLLLNLVDNALRFTPPGGSVTLDLARADGRAVLRVRDSGAGIAPEHLPHIFERFYRADASRQRASGGTGLGLAICREIAEAHGGTIAVESAPGAGSTFTVTLPATD